MFRFVPKKQLEDIWNDKKCRMPLSRIRWLSEEAPGSNQEAPGLYYARGEQNPIRRNRANGKNSRK